MLEDQPLEIHTPNSRGRSHSSPSCQMVESSALSGHAHRSIGVIFLSRNQTSLLSLLGVSLE